MFHPKLYYVRGRNAARLLVGSANLTTGGLNNNIEASIVLDLDLALASEKNLAYSVEDAFDTLPARYPSNITKMARDASLAELFDDPRLIDERVAPSSAVSKLSGGPSDLTPVPIIKLQTQRIVSRLPRRRTSQGAATRTAASESVPQAPLAASYELLWSADNLTERDLNMPEGDNTHATGSMNLDKGAMDDGFEFQTYFRNEVFNHLEVGSSRFSDELNGRQRIFVSLLRGLTVATSH